MPLVLKNLPTEISGHIYSYDNTYRRFFKGIVLPHMLEAVRDKIYRHLLTFADYDCNGLYKYITEDHFPLFLFYNHDKFYQLDKKFFNHYFRKLMLFNNQGYYLPYYYHH